MLADLISTLMHLKQPDNGSLRTSWMIFFSLNLDSDFSAGLSLSESFDYKHFDGLSLTNTVPGDVFCRYTPKGY